MPAVTPPGGPPCTSRRSPRGCLGGVARPPLIKPVVTVILDFTDWDTREFSPDTRPREQASAMTDRPPPSVCQQLADLHAYRLRTMAPADVQVNIDQRQLLEDTADRAAFVKAGDIVEPFSLPEVLGGTIELDRLLGGGPGGVPRSEERRGR